MFNRLTNCNSIFAELLNVVVLIMGDYVTFSIEFHILITSLVMGSVCVGMSRRPI
jgi:hypothetical protein